MFKVVLSTIKSMIGWNAKIIITQTIWYPTSGYQPDPKSVFVPLKKFPKNVSPYSEELYPIKIGSKIMSETKQMKMIRAVREI